MKRIYVVITAFTFMLNSNYASSATKVFEYGVKVSSEENLKYSSDESKKGFVMLSFVNSTLSNRRGIKVTMKKDGTEDQLRTFVPYVLDVKELVVSKLDDGYQYVANIVYDDRDMRYIAETEGEINALTHSNEILSERVRYLETSVYNDNLEHILKSIIVKNTELKFESKGRLSGKLGTLRTEKNIWIEYSEDELQYLAKAYSDIFNSTLTKSITVNIPKLVRHKDHIKKIYEYSYSITGLFELETKYGDYFNVYPFRVKLPFAKNEELIRFRRLFAAYVGNTYIVFKNGFGDPIHTMAVFQKKDINGEGRDLELVSIKNNTSEFKAPPKYRGVKGNSDLEIENFIKKRNTIYYELINTPFMIQMLNSGNDKKLAELQI